MEDGQGFNIMMVTVVVSLLVLTGIGAMIFYQVLGATPGAGTQIETFTVSNPAVDQVVTLTYIPSGSVTVDQYNSYAWVSVSSSYVTQNGRTITVNASGIDG